MDCTGHFNGHHDNLLLKPSPPPLPGLLPVIPRSLARSLPGLLPVIPRTHISPQTYDSAIIWAPTMKQLTAQNGKIRIICDGYRYRKDVDLAGGGSSFR